ncbi:MAG TPA: hypothetical protein GXZ90_06265 [Clostridiales bacterium]|nr:hypothetical protein [Clostridiales bacterium]
MAKVRVVTRTEYIIDLPIDSFEEIREDNMPIAVSDKMIIDYLSDNLDVGVDEVINVKPIR